MKDAINVWEKRRILGRQMPKDMLMAEIEDYIKNRTNCALATGCGTYVRNTPMRYSYKSGKFIFITEGGYKFKGLSVNPHVCIAIYDTGDLSSETIGVTIEGEAKISEMAKTSSVPEENTRFMITVTPVLIDYLNYKLPQRGYFQLQRLDLD